MKSRLGFCLVLVLTLMISSVGECRVGGGRSFGSRGSRGFTAPRSMNSSPYSRSYGSPYQAQPTQSPRDYSLNQPSSSRGSLLKSLGAGMAGGFLGSMLFRSLGGGGYSGYGAGSGIGGGAGIGLLEILLLGALLFFVIRMVTRRMQTQTASGFNSPSGSGAEELMRQARPGGWQSQSNESEFEGTPIQTDSAMDLFFQIQGAWGNRDLSGVQNLLDADAKSFLDQEISRLKMARQINRLENIAVRNVEVVESWQEANKQFSTVHFNANLLDFTVNEDSQQIVDGSKTSPVKFEEFWTFSKENGSNWKLAAIQQN